MAPTARNRARRDSAPWPSPRAPIGRTEARNCSIQVRVFPSGNCRTGRNIAKRAPRWRNSSRWRTAPRLPCRLVLGPRAPRLRQTGDRRNEERARSPILEEDDLLGAASTATMRISSRWLGAQALVRMRASSVRDRVWSRAAASMPSFASRSRSRECRVPPRCLLRAHLGLSGPGVGGPWEVRLVAREWSALHRRGRLLALLSAGLSRGFTLHPGGRCGWRGAERVRGMHASAS